LTLLVSVLGLVILDPGAAPLSHKAFTALWNASNLVSTLGDFIALSHAQRVFLLVVGLAMLIIGAYTITSLSGMLFSPDVLRHRENKSMQRKLDRLADHIVVVGFAGIGRRVCEQLAQAGERVLVIEHDEAVAESASALGYLVVQGDTGVDGSVLEQGAIERAKALVITVSDADRRLTITLMAHTLNPKLRIVVMAANNPRRGVLERAGATAVIIVDDLVASALIDRLQQPPPQQEVSSTVRLRVQ
jgi:hypothetical protein